MATNNTRNIEALRGALACIRNIVNDLKDGDYHYLLDECLTAETEITFVINDLENE